MRGGLMAGIVAGGVMGMTLMAAAVMMTPMCSRPVKRMLKQKGRRIMSMAGHLI